MGTKTALGDAERNKEEHEAKAPKQGIQGQEPKEIKLTLLHNIT